MKHRFLPLAGVVFGLVGCIEDVSDDAAADDPLDAGTDDLDARPSTDRASAPARPRRPRVAGRSGTAG